MTMKRILMIVAALMVTVASLAQQGPRNYYEIPSRSSVFTVSLGAGQLVLQSDSVRWLKLTNIVKAGWKLDTVYTKGWWKAAEGNTNKVYVNIKDYGAVGNGTTEDSLAVKAALSALRYTGGTIYFPAGTYKISCKIKIPRWWTYNLKPIQKTIRLTGAGNGVDPGSEGATVLNLKYNGSEAKIFTNGQGYLEIDHLTLKSDVSGSIPILLTTNTALKIHDVTFSGTSSACVDGIVLGGSNTTDPPIVADSTSASIFQGYGTEIKSCQFVYMKKAVRFRAGANGVVIKDCGFLLGCNTDDPYISIEGDHCTNCERIFGGIISDNMFTMTNRKYGIKVDWGYGFVFSGNNFYDADVNTKAGFYFTPNSGLNKIIEGIMLPGGESCLDSVQYGQYWNPNTFISDSLTRLRELQVNGAVKLKDNIDFLASGAGLWWRRWDRGLYMTGDTLKIRTPGNVGIGIEIPTSKLHVNGVITATGGTSTNWNTAYGWGNHSGLYVPVGRMVSTTSPLSGGGALSANLTLSMPAATTSANGYLTSTDWNTFNNKVSSQWTTSGSNIYYGSGNVGIGVTDPTTALNVLGTVTTSNIRLNSNPSSNGTSGELISLTAASSQAIGDVVFIAATTGKAALCKADAIANCPYAIAISTGTVSADGTGTYMTKGFIRNTSWYWTIGKLLYISSSATSGSCLVETAPSSPNNVIMPVAVALSSTLIYFFGNLNTVEKL